MTEPTPRNDFASFPAPAEGILVAMFITVRKVARSRDFYSRVLGGTVILEENPCTVRLSNSWIIMNPGGPPTPDKPGISVVDYEPDDTTSIFLNLRVADIQACYEEWKAKRGTVRHAADRPRRGDPLLPAGPGRIPDRGRPVHRPAARPSRRQAPGGSPRLTAPRVTPIASGAGTGGAVEPPARSRDPQSRPAVPSYDVNAAFMSFQPHESGIHAVWSGAGEARGTEVCFRCASQAGGEALGSQAMTFPRKRLVRLFTSRGNARGLAGA